MKNVLIALLFLLTMAGCLPKKKDAVTPVVEPDLVGVYQVSQLVIGTSTFNLPDGMGSSATAVITRVSATQIDLIVNIIENGTNSPTPFGTFTTRKASGKDYDVLNVSGTRVGSINGTDFTLNFTTSNGQRFSLTSRK